MSVVSRKEFMDSASAGAVSRRPELSGLSQDVTNRAIAMGQYRQNVQPDLLESLFRRAQELKSANQFDEALQLLQQLPAAVHSPLQLQGMMLQAEIFSLKGDFAKACQVYQNLQDYASQSLSLSDTERQRLQGLIHLNMAWLHEQNDELTTALVSYSLAITLLEPLQALMAEQVQSSLMMAYRQRSRVYRQLGNIDQALKDLEQSAQTQERMLMAAPDSELELVSGWFSLGQMQEEVEHWQEAFETFALALKLSEKITEESTRCLWQGMILTQQARCQAELGDSEQAVQLYQGAANQISRQETPLQWVQLQLLKAGLTLRLKHADALSEVGEIQAVLQQLEQAGSERTELAIPLIALADLCYEQNPEQALEFYGAGIRCLEQSQHQQNEDSQRLLVDAYRGRGNLLLQKGLLPKAQASYKQAQRYAGQIQTQSLRAELELLLGLAWQSAGKPETALASFVQAQSLSEVNPDPDSVWFRAGYFQAFVLAADLQQPQTALEVLLQLHAVVPHQVEYDLACLCSRLQRAEQAFDWLKSHLAGPHPLARDEISADADLAHLQQDPRWDLLWR